MTMLSSPREMMQQSYDAVVIGSGYGGGVAASRLARAGLKVCVLERGREIPVGQFPARLSEARRELQVTGRNLRFGAQTGLFDLRLGNDVNVLMGCGLGGTSLINANVCLRPDTRIFDDPIWPGEIVSDGLLAEGYTRAERMLRPLPMAGPPTVKFQAMEKAAKVLGAQLDRTPLHIVFSDGANAAGVFQNACVMCGDCCSGCNVGAKTTTQLTYLPDAVAHGAEIFTECSVRSLRRNGADDWLIILALPKDGTARPSLTAKIVVLAAGTLGSTEILLRSRTDGLALSPRLGDRFSANADAIAIGYNNDIPVNNVGVGFPPKADMDPVGPAVAALIDLRDTPELKDAIAIVEAAMPSSIAPLLPSLLTTGAQFTGLDSDGTLADELDEAGRALTSLINGAYRGAIHNTQTFLAIGHDDASGSMRLEDDRLTIHWPGAAQQAVYGAIEERIKQAVAATGGTYMPNPASMRLMGGHPMTVHPLGGCAIGHDIESGVVNHKGEVFDAGHPPEDGAVHRGLYVCDGAVIPRSVGIHPLLTITALAERAMMHLAASHGLSFDDEPAKAGAVRTLYAKENASAAMPGEGFLSRFLRRLGLRG
jgi:cholesterol oxidase